MPNISVIVPFYDASSFIHDALGMILGQSFEDFELIAIDDGSSDDTLTLLEEAAVADRRVKVVSRCNGGPGAARNTGLEHAEGDYVIFLDPDDRFHRDMLERLFVRAGETSADIVVCGSLMADAVSGLAVREPWAYRPELVPEQEPFCALDIPEDIFRFTIGWPWDKLFRREFIEHAGLRYPELRNSEDGAFVFPALLRAGRIATVDGPLVEHIMNREGSVSFSRKGNALCFYEQILIVRDEMRRTGHGDLFDRGFKNWALDNCLWNLRTAYPGDQEVIFEHLHDVAWKELGFLDESPEYYYVPSDYAMAVKMGEEHVSVFMEACELQHEVAALRASRSYRLGNAIMRPAKAFISFLRRAR